MVSQNGEVGLRLKPGPRLRGAIAAAVDLILPPQALDGGVRPMTSGLSVEAWSRIQFIEAPLCDGCGAPFEYDTGFRCAACTASPRAFDRARAACFYDDASRDLILQFKHADRVDLVPLFTSWLRRAAGELLAQADVIVPVPLHRGRLLKRKYNQAAEIARPLAAAIGARYLADTLRRARDTGSQAGRSGSGRVKNVQGAFKISHPARIAGKRVLIVDDVMTTGATVEACARALKRAGAVGVDVAVLARVKA